MFRKPTKSVFDNSAMAKSRFRKKTSGDNPSTRHSNSNSSSSLPASKDAKSKLSAFAFTKPATPRKSQTDDTDFETTPQHSTPAIEPDMPTPTRTVTRDVEPVQLPTPCRRTSLSDLPATPKPRLNIEHLLTDEEKPSPDSQPEDRNEVRVTWERSTPGVRMRYKRAASSSPPPARTPLNKRQAAIPTDDPAVELWKKYGVGMSAGLRKDRPDNPAVRLFAPDREDRSPSNLRRGTSIETPGTFNRLKRRKTQSFELFRESDPLESGLDVPAGTIKKTSRQERVVSLMDQVKQSMKQKARGKLPSLKSSPPPQADSEDPPQSSPLLAERHHSVAAPLSLPEDPTGISTTNDSDSEDFGYFDDADIDMEFIEKVEEIERITSTARQSQALAQSQIPQRSASPPQSAATPPAPLAHPETATVLDEFNEFGDDDVFGSIEFQELVAQYDAPAKGYSSSSRIKRFQVVEVSEGPYEVDARKSSPRIQKVVRVRDVESTGLSRVMLRDSWATSTTVSAGVFVHIVGSFDEHGVCVVDSRHNYIIVNPDFLVSATTVADTVSCMRKAALQERVKASGDITKAMVYGNVLHALFQSALEENDFSTERLNVHIIRVLTDNIESLFLLREEMPVAIAHIQSKLPLMQEWAKLFVSSKPNAKATVADHRGTTTPIVAINKLLDIEEHIWSPKYGLKGNIDATVQAIFVEPSTKKNGSARSSSKTLTIPLELKTGRAQSMAHRAQTMLYTLLMSDRYDIKVGGGLLYYLETSEMIRIPAIRNELRELVIKRNQVAHYICNRESLPDMLEDQHTCSRCYAKTSCFVYHKLLEDGTPESSGAAKPFMENTDHLNDKHKAFFKHWDTLLTKEEKGSFRFRREIWTMASSEREAAGRCFGKLVIVPGSISVDGDKQRINKYTYTLEKPGSAGDFSFIESQLGEGDPIVISDEDGHIALAIGYVSQLRKNRITVQVDRRLHNARTRQKDFNEDSNQVFDGIVEVNCTPRTPALARQPSEREEVFYRIDKDEFINGMAGVRNNLIQIMSKEANSKYRRLIAELLPPEFKESPTAYQLDEVPGAGSLNEDQKNAVTKVMSARDYALVLGMPGTGKTTTIAHIIRALVSQGKSVLLTSYTHTAVDNILLKIKNEEFGILRLGARAKIHHEVQSFAQLADTRYSSFEELRIAFNRPKVVATTCLGINHPIFSERQFDYCIVDEASQITLPVCLGPIRLADAFILVGDHYQLPPLVKNLEAKEGGLDISLFKLLSEAQPQAVVSLEHQYRMCEEIMALSNELIYSGRLKCGTPEVAKRALRLPNKAGLKALHKGSSGDDCQAGCWLKDLFAEGVKACFVDTDQVPAREEKMGDRTINPIEAELTYQIVEGFLSCGVDPSSIGVITVYRSQLKTIQHLLKHQEAVEMHTADKFQGRDKEVIVISLVRSNDQGTVGELLRDWRRINVAFTRARSKLIILGSRSTLRSNDLLKDFVGLMERNSSVYTLPADAHLHHRAVGRIGGGTSKRTRNGTGKENPRAPKRIRGRIPQGFLGNRPILKEIMNS